MALGASRAEVVGMVMRGAIYQTTLGLAIGVPVASVCGLCRCSRSCATRSLHRPCEGAKNGIGCYTGTSEYPWLCRFGLRQIS